MIRIDEIYNNTFWPWFEKNRPDIRMFFCDPPGFTGPENLFNLEKQHTSKTDFVFFHDQEPVDVELYARLFDSVASRNWHIVLDKLPAETTSGKKQIRDNVFVKWPSEDIKVAFHSQYSQNAQDFFRDRHDDFIRFRQANSEFFDIGHIVVSERGQCLEQVCQQYGWQPHYYFYHGWACLDWFRGYDRSFLIPRAVDRTPTKTFMSANRIVAGKRDHRVLFLYHLFKQNIQHNHISAPRVCQYEHVDISSIAQKYANVYHDIVQVLDRATLPRLFSGEHTQQMTSCWLSNFAEAQDSLIYVPTETVYFGRRTHITEKTFKAIALEMPFVLVATAGSLEYLREYGFKTFSGIFDEHYDTETDDLRRMELVIKLLVDLDSLTAKERQQIHRACLPVVQHNFNHFYRGGFSDILWKELVGMLEGLRV